VGTDTSLENGRVVAGRYRVEEKIGLGGMGAVYRVRHVNTDEALALKLLHAHVLRDASAVERFRKEARAPARITSEHVTRVTDADTAPELGDAPFVVMELLRGRDLEKIIGERGPLPSAEVVEYLRQAARALDKAHAIGMVHRDLKPENLFLTHRDDGSPCIKLLDFGIARLADEEGQKPMQTQAGYIFGTPNYMAPEQALGEVERIGPATDIWALGLVAFKLLVGREFFTAPVATQLYAMILSDPIPTPTAMGCTQGPAFDAWFAQCVSREIDKRFASASAAISALAAALDVKVDSMRHSASSIVALNELGSAQTVSVEDGFGLPKRSPSRRSLGIIVVAAVGVVALVIGVVAFASRGPSYGVVEATSIDAAAPPSTLVAVPPPVPETASPVPVALGAEPHAPSVPRLHGSAKPATSAAKLDPAAAREQKRRLDALQRLCDQGTYSAAECAAKRKAILNGP
jgi:serine/threonine-protein kinase